jgi:hypothetical protein
MTTDGAILSNTSRAVWAAATPPPARTARAIATVIDAFMSCPLRARVVT